MTGTHERLAAADMVSQEICGRGCERLHETSAAASSQEGQ